MDGVGWVDGWVGFLPVEAENFLSMIITSSGGWNDHRGNLMVENMENMRKDISEGDEHKGCDQFSSIYSLM